MVHDRTLNDTIYNFIVSGKLWSNSMIMMDRETESLWSHFTGECWEGPMQGAQLNTVPSVQTSWKEWKTVHPNTLVLKKDEAVMSSHYEDYFSDPDRIGIQKTEYLHERMPGKTVVHGIIHGPFTLAIVDSRIISNEPILTTLGEDSLSIVRDPGGGIRAHLLKDGLPIDELTVYPNFWFSWSSFHPNTEVIE